MNSSLPSKTETLRAPSLIASGKMERLAMGLALAGVILVALTAALFGH
jgi:hypothetical protein